MSNQSKSSLVLLALSLGCASTVREVSAPPAPVSAMAGPPRPFLGLKHRIAIAKFEDKTGYGNNLFGAVDDIGNQAADILASHLIKTGEFIILERQSLPELQKEAALQGQASPQLASVTALAVGAVTEFGTKSEWVDYGVSKTKVQTAHAKVTIRLVDPKTGVAFFSEFGEADAHNESSQTLGFGGRADYDATLTDKALNGAIAKLTGNMLSTLHGRPWRAAIVDVQPGTIAIGAGKKSNLKPGMVLDVYKPGKKVHNKLDNTTMELPGSVVGKVKVTSLFGEETAEGAMCDVISSKEPITTDFETRAEVQ
jgi:curli biogenesis system outer membrane secretion channel CsgG